MLQSRYYVCILIFTLVCGCNHQPVTVDDPTRSSTSRHTDRPLSLASSLADGILKERLLSCQAQPLRRSKFSIAHRGAPLGYPEHTREGYTAAALMGAGLIECDVTFTSDRALVCRHSQCDLHRTTNILQTELASQCTIPFTPATHDAPANAKCCTSDITLDQFRTLCGRRDVVVSDASSVDEYLVAPALRVNAPQIKCGTLMTHAESIRLFDHLGVDFIPELKRPEVPMTEAFSQADYATQMLNEYVEANIPAERVFPQSFSLADVQYWIMAHAEFAQQVVFLDPRGRDRNFKPTRQDMQKLRSLGVTTLAPPIPMLVTLDEQQRVVPSEYARLAREAGFRLITWTFESGRADDPTNWLYAPLAEIMTHEAKMLEVLDVLATQVGISGIFSDWPATVTYYDNCLN